MRWWLDCCVVSAVALPVGCSRVNHEFGHDGTETGDAKGDTSPGGPGPGGPGGSDDDDSSKDGDSGPGESTGNTSSSVDDETGGSSGDDTSGVGSSTGRSEEGCVEPEPVVVEMDAGVVWDLPGGCSGPGCQVLNFGGANRIFVYDAPPLDQRGYLIGRFVVDKSSLGELVGAYVQVTIDDSIFSDFTGVQFEASEVTNSAWEEGTGSGVIPPAGPCTWNHANCCDGGWNGLGGPFPTALGLELGSHLSDSAQSGDAVAIPLNVNWINADPDGVFDIAITVTAGGYAVPLGTIEGGAPATLQLLTCPPPA